MPRRKQDRPKRMKWEGGEEGSLEEGEKPEGEDDAGSVTPNSVSPPPIEEDAHSLVPADTASSVSPRSNIEETGNREPLSRCNSRESAEFTTVSRCPSEENERILAPERTVPLQQLPLGTALSPGGITLPPTLPSTLIPQQNAISAYINAAAAAAAVQSHRLMMTSPVTSGNFIKTPLALMSDVNPSSIISSPATDFTSHNIESVLDFSRRSKPVEAEADMISNVNKSETPPTTTEVGTAPLDLSVSNRKRTSEEPISQPSHRRSKTEFKPNVPSWPPSIGSQHFPYFAAAVAASLSSPKTPATDLWNGKIKPHNHNPPSEATKALEKMSELSKLGGDDIFRSMSGSVPSGSTSNRHSAWQSHWLNKGAEQAKDVLKCVWCKQSFPSLAALTTHMKEAKHCGVNVPLPNVPSNSSLPSQSPITSPSNTSHTSTSSLSSTKPHQSELNMLIKETMPLPRKLVRGQDVWLGKGAEQTRQILKCMWCGQSFRSLAEMTSHMQETQHYTNIISQEQIISWRSSDESKGSGSGSSSTNHQTSPGGPSSHVSAVLTCKVCDQAFSSLKELSNHMVKNSHYKEHIMRSITESGGRRRQTREKRKKSLPVRKLLELERAQHEFKNGDNSSILDKMRETASVTGRITCEKCGNKIETAMFVEHIRQCVGGVSSNQRNFLKSALMSNNILPPESPDRNKLKIQSDKSPSPKRQSPAASDLSIKESNPPSDGNNGSSPSVLNAIEKLIEKSFDSRTRQNAGYPSHGHVQAPIGSSILKRLGIDESVDYTKPLVDAQTMSLLRSYHHQQNHYNRRERSGSESSSVSERGSSRVDALTPERKMDPPELPLISTPRSIPDIKREKSPYTIENEGGNEHAQTIVVKKEIEEDQRSESADCLAAPTGLVIKTEKVEENEEDQRQNFHSNGDRSKDEEDKRSLSSSPQLNVSEQTKSTSPNRNSNSSPASSSDRSATPRSTASDRKTTSGSLGALSSMFDNLSGANASETNIPSGSKKGSSHPLAALQKLCDKTESHSSTRSHATSTVTSATTVPSTTSAQSSAGTGAILAFSWACNDVVMTPDSIMKCAFCDTPFISKGAYRHHLSKMHFVKDGVIPDPITIKTTQTSSSSSAVSSTVAVPLKGTTITPSTSSTSSTITQPSKSPPGNSPSGFEESPHSKFLKYTELAKQLSSKYV